MILIVTMAGQSSRFPNLRPKLMLTHPNGHFMGIESIMGLNLADFEKIYFTCLREHEEKHFFLKGFKEELVELGIENKVEFILLDEKTSDQPETVKQTILKAKISGPIVIKDSDNYFKVDIRSGNSVCFANLNSCGLIKPKNKSYITFDANYNISSIVEKQVISPFFSVGAYSFQSASDFMEALDSLPANSERYISHVVFQMILKGKLFSGSEVANYLDWGTIEDWDRYKKTFATLFLDLDGTLVKNSSSHFPPYIGNTVPIIPNLEIIKTLYSSGKFQIVITTSRQEKYRNVTENQLKTIGIPYDHLIMGLFHSKRIIINDYSNSNPFKSCDSINLKRDSDDLREILRESLGIDYELI